TLHSLMARPPPTSTLFPYTTLFRSITSLRSRLIYYFSLYLLPAIIVLCSVLAVMFLPERYPATNAQRLEFRHVPDPDAILTPYRSEEHTSELQSRENLVCRLLLEKK